MRVLNYDAEPRPLRYALTSYNDSGEYDSSPAYNISEPVLLIQTVEALLKKYTLPHAAAAMVPGTVAGLVERRIVLITFAKRGEPHAPVPQVVLRKFRDPDSGAMIDYSKIKKYEIPPPEAIESCSEADFVHDLLISNGFVLHPMKLGDQFVYHVVGKFVGPFMGQIVWWPAFYAPMSNDVYLVLTMVPGRGRLIPSFAHYNADERIWKGYNQALAVYDTKFQPVYWACDPSRDVDRFFSEELFKQQQARIPIDPVI